MSAKYIPPVFKGEAFHCPNCGTYAHQAWCAVYYWEYGNHHAFEALDVCRCNRCEQYSIWLDGKIVEPAISNTPFAHPDMPESLRNDYEEARKVFAESPRSSAALLRLVIQKLCRELGQKGKDVNADIGALVSAGLPVQIQQSLDIVRVVGNNAVHPGQLDVNDDPSIAAALFELVNLIVEDRIARPKQIESLYQKLPEGARKQIVERDAKALGKTP